MGQFRLVAPYTARGDQPQAIEALAKGVEAGMPAQVLLGVTGSGKTFTMANVIKNVGGPALRRVQGVFPGQRGGILRFLL